jgi:hypothetical protein
MASDIDISSNALQMIGATSISSFDDPGAGAQVASAIYEPILEAILTSNYWRFSIKKQSLNQLSQVPLNEFQYAYQIPTDSLKIERVCPRSSYKVFQDKIYSDQTSLELDYVFRPDTTAFPSYFTLMFTYKLASEFALAVTDNENKNQIYEAKYLAALADAYAADAQQYPQTPILDQPFTDVRNGGTGFFNGDCF